MDDFLFMGALASGQWHTLVARFLSLYDELGAALAADKAEGLATTLTFSGIEIDSVKQSKPAQGPIFGGDDAAKTMGQKALM